MEEDRYEVTLRVGRRTRGVQLILAGLAAIPANFVLSVVFAHDPLEPTRLLVAVAATVLLIAAGVLSIRASRTGKSP